MSTGGATESLASGIRFQHQEGQCGFIRVDGEMRSEIEHKEESPSMSVFPPDGLLERGGEHWKLYPKTISLSRLDYEML